MTEKHNLYKVNESRVVSETVESETILINLETGTYHSLNYTATLVWQCIVNGYSMPSIVKFLSDRYMANKEEIEKGIFNIFELLEKDGLIIKKESESTPAPEHFAGPKQPFQTPVVESYDDMQEMLLADPIHDVDATGWPKLKDNA